MSASTTSTPTLGPDIVKPMPTTTLHLTLTPRPDGDDDSALSMYIGLHSEHPQLSEILTDEQGTEFMLKLARPIGEWVSMRTTPGLMPVEQVKEMLADSATNGFKDDVSRVFGEYGLRWTSGSVAETVPGEARDWSDDGTSYCESFASKSTAVGSFVYNEEGKEETGATEATGTNTGGGVFTSWFKSCFGGRK